MGPDLSDPKIRFVLRAVRDGVKIARRIRDEMRGQRIIKQDRSPVTAADFAVQALVSEYLRQDFPGEVLVAEENPGFLLTDEGAEVAQKITEYVRPFLPAADAAAVCEWIGRGTAAPCERFWTLDPIDGTRGFVRGGQYAVALALIEGGEVTLGALGCPHLSCGGLPEPGGPGGLFIAAKGKGSWFMSLEEGRADAKRLSVSSCSDPARACVVSSYESGTVDVEKAREIAADLGTTREFSFMDSLAKHAVVAAGAADISIRLISPTDPLRQEYIWDQAAGTLLIEEAGGRVSDLDGKPLDYRAGRKLSRNKGVVLTNGHLHEAVLAACRRAAVRSAEK